MKLKFLILLALMLASCYMIAQNIGQTKSYIINEYSDCRIEVNNEVLLILACSNDNVNKFYGFDQMGLCIIEGSEFHPKFIDEFKEILMNVDKYRFLKKLDHPVLLSMNENGYERYTKAEQYENGKFLITIAEHDLRGNPDSDKYTVYRELIDN